AALSARELILQVLDLPRRDDRRQPGELAEHGLEARTVAIDGLLRRVAGLPARGMPVGRNGCLSHGRFVSSLKGGTIPPGPGADQRNPLNSAEIVLARASRAGYGLRAFRPE